MKTTAFTTTLFAFALLANTSFAQSFVPSYTYPGTGILETDASTTDVLINGKLGLGTNPNPTTFVSPVPKLSIGGDIALFPIGGIMGNSNIVTMGAMHLQCGGFPTTTFPVQLGSEIDLYSTGGGSGINFLSNAGNFTFIYSNYSSYTYNSLMTLQTTGELIIGNVTSPAGYKLYVQDGILTEKVKVASSTGINWSDFVFKKDYKLMPLNDLEKYINKKQHLPAVPSAKDVNKDGIDLAQMDAKLLQKIEELTLYIIQQQKEIDELKNKISK